MKSYSYYGKEYSESEILGDLDKFPDLVYRKCENKYVEAARHISEGKIVGWMQGCSEFGPRALGNRSILADPRKADMKDILNKRVKFRESFRPFAPAILIEETKKYFELECESPYMLIVSDVVEKMKKVIPSTTHVDGTGRVQTVTEHSNPEFYQLITEFNNITEVPVVLNTSFNIKGEPIVESPYDAINCYVNTNIDVLFVGDYIFEKK